MSCFNFECGMHLDLNFLNFLTTFFLSPWYRCMSTTWRCPPVMLAACRKGALFFHVHTGGEVTGAQATDGVSGGAWEIRKTAGLPLACGS